MRVEWDYNKRKLDPSASPLDPHSKQNDCEMSRMMVEWDWSKGEADGSSFRYRVSQKRKHDPSASPLDSQFDCSNFIQLEWLWNEKNDGGMIFV